MIKFVGIKAFICFHRFLFSRIEIRRSENIQRSKVWITILIEIAYCRFSESRFNFFIDGDRDRSDAHCTTDCSFRFDLDRNDCTRSLSRFDIVNNHLQNRVSTENDESRLSSFSRVDRLILNLSQVKRESVGQSITIKWRILDNNEIFFMIFVKNINFLKDKFIVDEIFFWKTRISSTTIF